MPILIDGYNLMHAAGLGKRQYGPGGLEKARRALLGALAAGLGEEASHTTVVFDAAGAPPDVPDQFRYRELHVRFSANHDDADALLEELIGAYSAPRRLTVVSSDHRVQRAARRRRAQVAESEQFLGDLARRRKGPSSKQPPDPAGKLHGPASKAELDFWFSEFEVSEDANDELDGFGLDGIVPLK